MPFPSRWLTGVVSLALVCAAGPGRAIGQRPSPPDPSGGSVALANGVTISPACGPSSAAQHIAFSATASHKFLGYGANVGAEKASSHPTRTLNDLRQLGFVWIRTFLTKPGLMQSAAASASAAVFEDDVRAQVRAGLTDEKRKLYETLHDGGIRIVETIHLPEGDYFALTTANNGKPGRRILPSEIPNVARYYAAYLRGLVAAQILPDLIEPINEPNLPQNGKFDPSTYAEFAKDLETNLSSLPGSPSSGISLSGPGTTSHVPAGLRFVEAMDARGALSSLKAITIHAYYIRDRPINSGIPPADDPAFRGLAAAAGKLGIPLIATEFGGTDLKTKRSDPGRESVDTAEEMKAALDLIREGGSAAIVWNLYSNVEEGKLEKTWALLDEHGPTNAYWPFYILARRVPVGSDVLAVKQSDVAPTMTSLGYAAFRSGRRVYVGLANASPQMATTVDLDLSSLGHYSVTHASSFEPTRAIEQDAAVAAGTCHLAVTIPGGTGTVLDITQLK